MRVLPDWEHAFQDEPPKQPLSNKAPTQIDLPSHVINPLAVRTPRKDQGAHCVDCRCWFGV